MKPYRFFLVLDDENSIRGVLKDMDVPNWPFIKLLEVTYSTYLDFYFMKA